MSLAGQTLEDRVEELSTRVQALELQLEALTMRIGDGETSAVISPLAGSPPVARSEEYPLGEPSDVSEEMLTWAGRAALLPRLSTLCFLLVVALILRTITDSGLVDNLVGSGLGMFYAAALMALGWYKYEKGSALAPVFAACGAVLMPSIVVETHAHFQSLPIVPAYLTLMATGIGAAVIGRRFNAFIPISIGILGMCLAGAAIDYPHPYFPYLAMVLITANVLGYFAAQLKQCSWLRWTVLIVTISMLQLWALRLGLALRRGETPPPELAATWFLPIVSVFAVTFLVLALIGIVRTGTAKISRFDFVLPTLNAGWAFTAALYVIDASGKGVHLIGVVGVIVAIIHLAVIFWLARRGIKGAPGSSSFTFAGGLLLALALPPAIGMFTLSLPVISSVAIFLAVMSRVWENGGVRCTTYLFHIYSCAAIVVALQGEGPAVTDFVNVLPAGLLAVVILYQYQWCRRYPPPAASVFFNRFDNNDRSAVLLLLAALVCGFYMMRIGIYQVVQMLPGETHRDAFRCAQSVLINGSAVGLVLFAYLRRNREIRNVAILVTIIGGIKVFLYDLLGAHGLPLVFSVFSFGLAAAIESVALGKWLKKPDDEEVDVNQ
jgi:hypothetical protein